MSEKQEIYLDFLGRILPYIRNRQTWGFISKGRDKSCYYEAELIHNLNNSILDGDFVEHDIWFLNAQAKWYLEKCNDKISPLYTENVKSIKRLIELVPEDLKKGLGFSIDDIKTKK